MPDGFDAAQRAYDSLLPPDPFAEDDLKETS